MLTIFVDTVRYLFVAIACVFLFIGYLLTADCGEQTFKQWYKKYMNME